MVYAWLLQRWTAHRASTVTLVTPPVALMIGRLVAAESISFTEVVAAALVVGGVATVLLSQARSVAPVLPRRAAPVVVQPVDH